MKYLYKYIYKGHDLASVVVTDASSGTNEPIIHDEIKNHIETRYVSPVEACYRIYGREMQHKSHSIIRLPVHLPNQQVVAIADEGEDTIRTALEKQTMLMDYFTLNQRNPEARMYTYGEIPSYFVFQKNTPNRPAMWKKRLRHFNAIGRMYSISPRQIELFHLRLLLLTIKGATSFEDLRTVNNVVHDTYHGACVALGPIEDDSEWDRAMTEEEIWMMPRHLFVILIYCQPNKPNELWENFKDALSEDFKHKGHSGTQSYARAYHEINTLLGQENSSVSQFPSMPSLAEFEKIDDIINDEGISLQNHEQIGLAQYAKSNEKQKQIVDEILNVAMSKQPTKTCFTWTDQAVLEKHLFTTLFTSYSKVKDIKLLQWHLQE
ncbi:uncharacterized protein LOC122850898 [Aphidius gifuensis]|uniref:uncharacterized protein LOC122850898 n=1 Tax=Aphidius gifuensis TaxID=684658 RepID=UPI001CDBC15D|nr:uncharacterized protein LOC122850898 [Aphidius gifuensis]